jgi:hypothetical protein
MISYTGILLDDLSHNKLVLLLGKHFPIESESWKVYAHHMTVCLGGLSVDKKNLAGKVCKPTVSAIGKSDMAIAVRLSGDGTELTTNAIPHVTLAVNPNGGKPVMSNQITDWTKIDNTFILVGTIKEFEK